MRGLITEGAAGLAGRIAGGPGGEQHSAGGQDIRTLHGTLRKIKPLTIAAYLRSHVLQELERLTAAGLLSTNARWAVWVILPEEQQLGSKLHAVMQVNACGLRTHDASC